MFIWIRIRHIPANYFTTETMFNFAEEVGKLDEIAYDPKVSHIKDYIRALVCFNVTDPLKASRKLSTRAKIVTIGYEYEKIHKRCFHCFRMTDEKVRCPLLRKGVSSELKVAPAQSSKTIQNVEAPAKLHDRGNLWEGPPGFPPLFSELSKQDNIMALQYISHVDDAEQMARI